MLPGLSSASSAVLSGIAAAIGAAVCAGAVRGNPMQSNPTQHLFDNEAAETLGVFEADEVPEGSAAVQSTDIADIPGVNVPVDASYQTAYIKIIYTPADEESLSNVILVGDEEKVKELLDGFFSQAEVSGRAAAEYLVMNLIRSFVRLIANIKIKNDESKYKFENMLHIIKLDDIAAMKTAATELACDLCKQINSIRQGSGDSYIKERVIKYVEENYSDRELDVSKISDHLGFSPSYAIRLFKQETGEGIASYINRVRVEKAKELLMLDFYRVEQIAKMVGFLDSRSLSRTFKKFYGITPTEYRDIASLETNNE